MKHRMQLPSVRFSFPIQVIAFVLAVGAVWRVSASDWPAYRRDARRSAVSEDRLPFPLELAWHRQPQLPPRPAFEDPLKHPTDVDFAYVRDTSEPVLLDFDHAFHPVAAGGRVFFGSSADDSVRCLSLATGKQQWAFVAGGPVRFAPQVVEDRVYVASDDGFVYCLNAADGDVVWKFRAAPSDRQLVGNGRMISRWPLRSGVLVLDGVLYVTAGMWPAEGVFVYALNAKTGEVHWVNDTSGTLNQPTVNRGAYAITGVAPTGYLLAGKEALVVPTGRSIPASYSLQDGRLLASTAPSYQNRRGGPAVCIDRFDNVLFGYPRERLTTREYGLHYAYQLPNLTQFGMFRGDRILAADRTFLAVNDVIRCFEGNSRYTKAKVVWQQPCPSRSLRCMALSANALLMGIDDRVVGRDRTTGQLLWEKAGLGGYVQSIAVADQRVLVATDRGSIYCFAAEAEGIANPSVNHHASKTDGVAIRATAWDDVLRELPTKRGLALVLGESDTRLAMQIAAASRLQVVVLLDGAAAVAKSRQALLDTHLPGRGQVSVQHHVAERRLPFTDFAFNLIFSKGDVAIQRAAELYRVLRPAGGVLHVSGNATQLEKVTDIVTRTVSEARRADQVRPAQAVRIMKQADGAVAFRRGKLPGALDWDSEALTDRRVKWPLELLWFGGPGSKRTGGGSRPPIAAGGRNFVIGKNHLIALDAYNGTELWSRTLPYLYRTIGRLPNMPGPIQPWLTESINADDDNVWLNFGHVVYTLDANTGRQLAVHGRFPTAPVMKLGDDGLRFTMDHYQLPDRRGTASQRTKAVTPAGEIQLNIADGQLTVTLELHTDVVLEDRVYWELFLDARPPKKRAGLYEPGLLHWLARPATGVVSSGVGSDHPQVSVTTKDNGRRLTVAIPLEELEKLRGGKLDDFCFAAALNHPTGDDQKAMAGGRAYLRWEFHADAYATSLNNGWPRIVLGRDSSLPAPSDVQAGSFRQALPPISELPEWALKTARIGGVGQRAGSVVKLKGQRETPLSLEVCEFEFNRGKGCGRLVSSEFLEVLRSGTLAFYDKSDDSGMRYFGGVRPACTISAIPAQGLVFAAEGSSGCSCNYNFKTTLALAPAKQRRHEDWAMFTAPLSPGAQLRAGRFNLGAPGDRRDDGGLWLQFPRAPTYSSRILPTAARTMPVPVQLLGTHLKPYRVNADRVTIEGTDRPWLYASGYEGLEGVLLRLFMSDQEGVVVFPAKAPKLDAILEAESWKQSYSVPAGTGGKMFLTHSRETLYVGYEIVPPVDRRGQRLPWNTREGKQLPHSEEFAASEKADDSAVWEEDSLELLVSDTSLQTILHFGVGVTGGRYDGLWSATAKEQDATASPAWSGAFRVSHDKAVAEFAIARQTLEGAGLDLDRLVIRPRMKGPVKRQPHISHGFRPVIFEKDQPATRQYSVKLHFAELRDTSPGERVFDIQIQGKTVAKSFDPVAEAGGVNRAVVQTFNNISADRVLDIRFVGSSDQNDQIRPPILSAVEVLSENR